MAVTDSDRGQDWSDIDSLPEGSPSADEESAAQSGEEEESVLEATRLSARLIYEVIRRDGHDEITRPLSSLSFSGLAAGILISFSVITEAIFRMHLPDNADWTFLVENLGYSAGFMIVILGRMQLFTENTITTVLPIMAKPCREYIIKAARLWTVVLGANVVGAFVAAAFMLWTETFDAEFHTTVHELAVHATGMGFLTSFYTAMPAGVLVAAIVWMLPTAPRSSFWVILFFTWLIAAGDFSHVVAGSVEMAYLILEGDLNPFKGLFLFFLPVLAGNIVGGTAVFTLITWAQVRDEVRHA